MKKCVHGREHFLVGLVLLDLLHSRHRLMMTTDLPTLYTFTTDHGIGTRFILRDRKTIHHKCLTLGPLVGYGFVNSRGNLNLWIASRSGCKSIISRLTPALLFQPLRTVRYR